MSKEYGEEDGNSFYVKVTGVLKKMLNNESENLSLKDRIRAKLDEATFYFDNEEKEKLRNQKAKIYNLKHMGHGTYKNPSGHEFAWDDSKNEFYLLKKNTETKPNNVVPFSKKDSDSNDISNLKVGDMLEITYKDPNVVSKFSALKGHTLFKVDRVEDEGNSVGILYGKKGYRFKAQNADVYFWQIANDNSHRLNFKKLDSTNASIKEEPKSIFNNPPPGGFTDADKVPLSVNDKINKAKEFRKKNLELLKTQDVYNKKKGDTFKQIEASYYSQPNEFGKEKEYTISKVINLADKKVFHTIEYGKFSIPHPDGYKHSVKEIKPIKDRILDKLNLETDFEEVEDDESSQMGVRTSKFITKDYALKVTNGHDIYIKIYSNPENIGKKGTKIKETSITIDYGMRHNSRIAWGSTFINRLKDAKPKTMDDLLKFIDKQAEEIKQESPSFRMNKYEYDMKGIDRDIPDFGLEGEYEDFSGKDIVVRYKKPTISIKSKKRIESDADYYNSGIDVKWNYAKKLKKIEKQLKDAENQEQIIKLFDENGIKYKTYMYSRWD